MHNRLRMLTASFLVKDLHVDWRWGSATAHNLNDFDSPPTTAAGSGAASTGCDAQPLLPHLQPGHAIPGSIRRAVSASISRPRAGAGPVRPRALADERDGAGALRRADREGLPCTRGGSRPCAQGAAALRQARRRSTLDPSPDIYPGREFGGGLGEQIGSTGAVIDHSIGKTGMPVYGRPGPARIRVTPTSELQPRLAVQIGCCRGSQANGVVW